MHHSNYLSTTCAPDLPCAAAMALTAGSDISPPPVKRPTQIIYPFLLLLKHHAQSVLATSCASCVLTLSTVSGMLPFSFSSLKKINMRDETGPTQS